MMRFGRIKKLFGFGKEEKKEKKPAPVPIPEPEEKKETGLSEAIRAAEEECRLNLNEEMRAAYVGFLENCALREDHILYEAFGGRGMTCSPYAIFKYLLTQADFADFVHVWVIDDFEDNRWQMERYRDRENVKFIRYQSLEYREYLATCKYLVNNVSFPGYFTKRRGQIYVDTWHGIPLKTIGFDIPAGNVSAGNTARNLLAADYLIAPNGFMTDIYRRAFKMEGIYEGMILQEGQPRNDGYFHTERKEIMEKLAACGMRVDPGKKIILYAPTWKGSKYSSPDTSLDAYYEIIRRIEKNVDTEEYQVLVKPHQIVYYHIRRSGGLTGQFVPATVDTNELLSAVDILISDYSSIYFDFLVSGRPVLFFIPDLDEYLGYRGLYFGIDKLPGPVAKNYAELEEMIRDPEKAMAPFREKYRREAAWACPKDDGDVCRRVADVVFRGKEPEDGVRCGHTEKKKLLLYAGNLEASGKTFSFCELAKLLDPEKYDATLLAEGGGDEEAQNRILSLPGYLRILYRGQPENALPEEKARHEMTLKKGPGIVCPVPEEMYRRELRRLFGEARFDYALDLTGDRGLFSSLLPYMEGTKTLSWSRRLTDLSRMKEQQEKPSVLTVDGESLYITKLKEPGASVRELQTIPLPAENKKNYAAMGRLEEKADFAGLLAVFEKEREEDGDIHLYILGDGPEREALKNAIKERGLAQAVTLTGYVDRPFAFLEMCGAFVRAPGQSRESLSVLEAGTLKMKLLKPDFTLEEPYSFDPEVYNREVYREFERLFDE